MAELLSFFRAAPASRGDWTTQEIAEFYRVEAALIQAGLRIVVDRGLSDEGDPWFVFCRAGDGEVIVHFARIGHNYIIVADSMGRGLEGPDFRALLSQFISRNPTLIPTQSSRGARLLFHPASLLAAVVATALCHLSGSEAVASTIDPSSVQPHHGAAKLPADAAIRPAADVEPDRVIVERHIAAATIAMLALAATQMSYSADDQSGSIRLFEIAPSSEHDLAGHTIQVSSVNLSGIDLSLDRADLLATSDAADAKAGVGSGAEFVKPSSGTIILSSIGDAPASAASDRLSAPDLHDVTVHHVVLSSEAIDLALADGIEHSGLITLALITGHQGSATRTASSVSAESAGAQKIVVSDSADLSVSSQLPQSASALLTSDLLLAHRTTPQIVLSDGLSVQEIIKAGTAQLLGSTPTSLLEVSATTGSASTTTTGSADLAANTASSTSSSGTSSSTSASSTSATNTAASDTLLTGSASNDHVSGKSSADLATSHTPPPGDKYELFDQDANLLLSAFIRENNFEVIRSGKNFVLFDTDAADFAKPDLVVKTWEMHDGSTMSIVGQIPHDMMYLL
ncbi:hypothetical protein [Rhodopseudomonas palustris]|uniref:hypothetical protein n=1 Tax=Rhodopseudomonas palustris TaxID=1076 RepID=UPI000D1B4985|nr:hypothetical protein [Rhodopseudomonas palustris]AVT82963.1 hypothetical protein RPYSC3_41030 [Rhodopseudomonas palustris]